jgi:quercetin dioxygenase-like cupin family protein
MRTLLIVVALMAVAGCAPRTPHVTLAPLAPGLDAFIVAHPIPADQPLRVDEVGRGAAASYHLVQVRSTEVPHRHAKHDLTVFVLRGHGILTLKDVQIPLGAGDAAVIMRGEPHWFANDGREPAVAFVVYTPALAGIPDIVPLAGR